MNDAFTMTPEPSFGEASRFVESVMTQVTEENTELREGLMQVQQMLAVEDANWTRMFGSLSGDNYKGLELRQLKDVYEKIQEYLVGNPVIKRGSGLRSSYVWSKGVNVPGVDESPGRRGRKTDLERFYRDERTQMFLTSSDANEEMERSAFAGGMYLLSCNNKTRRIEHPVPIDEIVQILVNPEYNGEIWAYEREWDSYQPDGSIETKNEWIYTDRAPQKVKKDQIGGVKVNKDRTILDVRFNTQVGWPLGIPDGLAAVVWARIYSEMVHHGRVMTESLAKYAFTITQTTQKGAKSAGVSMQKGGGGQAAVLGAGNSMQPLLTAGKTYDFNGIRPIAAMVAASLEVSIVHLLSDPGAAGSSYGSASNLDLPTKRAIITRQEQWAAYMERVFKWATNEDVNIAFPPLDDDPYRQLQSIVIAWGTGLLHEEEARGMLIEALGVQVQEDKAPKGVLLPNNEASLPRKDIDTDGEPGSSGSSGASAAGKQAAAPGQGQANGGGGAGSTRGNDIRQDTIGEAIRQAEHDDKMAEMNALVDRLVEAMNQRPE